ncbi:cytochrome P450 [Aspergillus karnatakaensis]|uniref:cytochrome P450 n=1 Tax=Aspergillus karnatakaensis TaxID=1810916 RepID=UPI003CCE28CA
MTPPKLTAGQGKIHAKYGDVFLVVTPTGLTIEVADASLAIELPDCEKPSWPYRLPDICGANVVSVGDIFPGSYSLAEQFYQATGDMWRRHRKAVYPGFSDKTYKQAWVHSLRFAQQLPREATDKENPGIRSIGPRLDSLVLRVLLAVSCGVSVDEGHESGDGTSSRTSKSPGLVADLTQLMDNAAVFIIPRLCLKYGPRTWRRLHAALKNTKEFLKRTIETQKKGLKESRKEQVCSQTLLNTFLDRSMGLESKDDLANGDQATLRPASVSDEEVVGNTFILFFAGVGTLSETLKFSFVLLAMHPEIQDWVIEDIAQALADQPTDPSEWKFGLVFPRLIAPFCVMLETLRQYPPTMSVTKWTGDKSRAIKVADKSYVLPTQATVQLSLSALHYHPKHWGSNPKEFRPQNWDPRCICRWETGSSAPEGDGGLTDFGASDASPKGPRIPVKGSFLPFSEKARRCIGRRLAEVEFVAIMAVVLRDHRVELVVDGTESWGTVKAEVQDLLDRSLLAPTIKCAASIPIRFIKRQD